jgi:hypothetical protein
MLLTPVTQVSIAVFIGNRNKNKAAKTEINNAIVGSSIKRKKGCGGFENAAPIVPAVIKNTGNKAITKLLKTVGEASAKSGVIFLPVFTVFSFMIILGKITPAITAMGRLSIIPYNSVSPIPALKIVASAVGPG